MAYSCDFIPFFDKKLKRQIRKCRIGANSRIELTAISNGIGVVVADEIIIIQK